MINKLIIFLFLINIVYSVELKDKEHKNERVKLILEVEDSLISISNYIRTEEKNYHFIDSIHQKIELIMPKYYEVIDSVLEINLMGKNPNYSILEGETELIFGGCCGYYKGDFLYLEMDSIFLPFKYVKIGYNKYDGFYFD